MFDMVCPVVSSDIGLDGQGLSQRALVLLEFQYFFGQRIERCHASNLVKCAAVYYAVSEQWNSLRGSRE